MSDEPKIVPVSEITKPKRSSPMARILAEVPDGYRTTAEVAEFFDVHVNTLRRLANLKRVKAPSNAITRGKMVVYLYNKEDMDELKNYFEGTNQ